MKALVFLLVVLSATAAHAEEKCTSMCHFFEAWALTKVCHNLILTDEGRQTERDYSKFHSLFQNALADVKSRANVCNNIECMWITNTNPIEGTACQYLKYRRIPEAVE
jgi:hypothetical protein